MLLLLQRSSLRSLAWMAFALLLVPLAHAQVSVAPVALFMDDTNRFGSFYITNQTSTPQEVEVDFRFGYPAADEAGNIFMQYEDSVTAELYSLAPYLRSFPRQFVLPPGESQVVRLTARLPSARAEGYYWARLITTSTPQATLSEDAGGGVSAEIVFRVQQVTAVLYKRGQPEARIAMYDLAAEADSGAVVVSAFIERLSDSPFLGRAVVQLLDENGNAVAEQSESVSAYVSLRRRFNITIPDDLRGDFTAVVTLSAERPDVPVPYRTTINPVSASIPIHIE